MKTFRIDDIGASTKKFEQYSRFKWANFWFLKRLPFLKAWGPYSELTAKEWLVFLNIFKTNHIKPIIAITATWVDKNSSLIPFPEKFPTEAKILKQALKNNLIEIANHGLTHCVVGRHLPLLRHSNRYFHREFWPDLDQSLHTNHILKSQKILEDYFEQPLETFVPPGNVWGYKTYLALKQTSIKKVISARYMLDSKESMVDIKFINDRQNFFTFHDRELKLYGPTWLKNKIKSNLWIIPRI